MSCWTVRKSISAYLDGVLAGDEMKRVSRHVAGCRKCAARSTELRRTREMLHEAPKMAIPQRLSDRLRVMASHERQRRMTRMTWSAQVREWKRSARLCIDNLMRPLAVPFAGGILSTLVMFGALAPSLGTHRNLSPDVPISLYTHASLEEMSDVGYTDPNADAVVELVIDAHGQVTGYSIEHGKITPQLENSIANVVLFSTFTPATWFGQPTAGKVLVTFTRSHIVVRG